MPLFLFTGVINNKRIQVKLGIKISARKERETKKKKREGKSKKVRKN